MPDFPEGFFPYVAEFQIWQEIRFSLEVHPGLFVESRKIRAYARRYISVNIHKGSPADIFRTLARALVRIIQVEVNLFRLINSVFHFKKFLFQIPESCLRISQIHFFFQFRSKGQCTSADHYLIHPCRIEKIRHPFKITKTGTKKHMGQMNLWRA